MNISRHINRCFTSKLFLNVVVERNIVRNAELRVGISFSSNNEYCTLLAILTEMVQY